MSRLDDLEAKLAAGMPGEWDSYCRLGVGGHVVGRRTPERVEKHYDMGWLEKYADADLIVSLHNAAPALIAVARAAEAFVAKSDGDLCSFSVTPRSGCNCTGCTLVSALDRLESP